VEDEYLQAECGVATKMDYRYCIDSDKFTIYNVFN